MSAPSWLLTISPFHHVTQVPLVAVDRRGTAVMLAVAAVAAGVAWSASPAATCRPGRPGL